MPSIHVSNFLVSIVFVAMYSLLHSYVMERAVLIVGEPWHAWRTHSIEHGSLFSTIRKLMSSD